MVIIIGELLLVNVILVIKIRMDLVLALPPVIVMVMVMLMVILMVMVMDGEPDNGLLLDLALDLAPVVSIGGEQIMVYDYFYFYCIIFFLYIRIDSCCSVSDDSHTQSFRLTMTLL